MTKRSRPLLICLLILSLLLPYTAIYATSSDTFTLDEVTLLNDIKNIQSEMALAAQSAYANKIAGKSTKAQSKILETVATQIDFLSSALQPYENVQDLTLEQSNTLLTLFNIINFLKFMQQDLSKYINATDNYTAYQLLVAYVKTDSFLSQVLVDYEYIQ